MKRIAATIVLFLILAIWVQSMRQEAYPTRDLPGIEFLGEGPADYDIGYSKSFIVKRSPIDLTLNLEPPIRPSTPNAFGRSVS